jgi:hypothetical protein
VRLAALEHCKMAAVSDNAIAKRLGIDHVTIGHWRKKICPSCEFHKMGKRKGGDCRLINLVNMDKSNWCPVAE